MNYFLKYKCRHVTASTSEKWISALCLCGLWRWTSNLWEAQHFKQQIFSWGSHVMWTFCIRHELRTTCAGGYFISTSPTSTPVGLLWLHSALAKCRTMISSQQHWRCFWMASLMTEDLALLNLMFDVMNSTPKPPSQAKLKQHSPYVSQNQQITKEMCL